MKTFSTPDFFVALLLLVYAAFLLGKFFVLCDRVKEIHKALTGAGEKK